MLYKRGLRGKTNISPQMYIYIWLIIIVVSVKYLEHWMHNEGMHLGELKRNVSVAWGAFSCTYECSPHTTHRLQQQVPEPVSSENNVF